MKLGILGLGNPEKRYAFTRHNVGHWLIDVLYSHFKTIPVKQESFFVSSVKLSSHELILLKSVNFMNSSGIGLKNFLHNCSLDHDNLLVVHDEMNLPLGRALISLGKSDGGHNGVLSVHQNLGHRPPRLRIGVGSKPKSVQKLSDYVLAEFSKDDLIILNNLFPKILHSLELILRKSFSAAMNFTNQNPLPSPK